MRENLDLKDISLENIKNLKIHGRTSGRLSPLALFWTGSGIELNVSGTDLWLELESDYSAHEPWLVITINSVPVSRLMLVKGRNWICLFRGMAKEKVKNIRIFKDTQAMGGDPDHSLVIHTIKTDGDFFPIEDRPYKIEFVGDSISSGEGAIGAKEETDWISMWFSSINNYTKLTADAINADYRVVSQSGFGVLTGWDNNPNSKLPAYYEKVCGLMAGDKNRELGALEDYDFKSWQPDIVLVNLGTNDETAFTTPGWADPETGKVYKQELNPDGTYKQECLDTFMQAVEDFLFELRKYNKGAYIIWAYGMGGTSLVSAIDQALRSYKDKSGDDRVAFLQLPTTTEETIGSIMHPGRLDHERAAKVLTKFIRKIL
ncbi:MAG TPA: SGNH/GDSL hydrolase family protein [Bacillota bacterium]|nr:SGNH/GDSL hydrolase family protein [Bacillota bacterium]